MQRVRSLQFEGLEGRQLCAVDLVSRALPGDGSDSGNAPSSIQSTSSLSADGRYIAFVSQASNLVPGDTNRSWDIFVRDNQTGICSRVSTDSSGGEANGDSYFPSISADGRYVAFQSFATNLVAGDTNGYADIFVKDLLTGALNRIGSGNGDSSTPIISGNGRYVAFSSTASNLVSGDGNVAADIFVRDLQLGTLVRASVTATGVQGGGDSLTPVISSDGRYVAFASYASNLVANDTNTMVDIFWKDMQTGNLQRVSTDGAAAQGNMDSYAPSISGDGQWVAFQSYASNFVANDTNGASDIFLKNVSTGAILRVSNDSMGNQSNGSSFDPVVSADGSKVAFYSLASSLVAGDTNSAADVFIKDVATEQLTLVSATGVGGVANLDSYTVAMARGGDVVAFYSYASNLLANDANGSADVYLRDIPSNQLTLVSSNLYSTTAATGNSDSDSPKVSSDGRYVVFSSLASNLVSGDTNGKKDVFRKDLQTGVVSLVSVTAAGMQGNGDSEAAAVSADGRYVAFVSLSSNLLSGDVNQARDVFVKDMQTGVVSLVSANIGGAWGVGGDSTSPAISSDGRYVAFVSAATNLVSGDTNGSADIYRKDLQTGAIIRVNTDGAQGQVAGGADAPSISADGGLIAFSSLSNQLVSGDGNGAWDVFLKNVQTGSITRVSTDSSGLEGAGNSTQPSLSTDGRYVAFQSTASLVALDANGTQDIYVKDLQTGTVTLVSCDELGATGSLASSSPSISPSGRYIVFVSGADNLVALDGNGLSDVFRKDLQTGAIVRLNLNGSGAESLGGGSFTPSISADGNLVAFASLASNLTSNDGNQRADVWVKNVSSGGPTTVSSNYYQANGVSGNQRSDSAKVSADGRYIAFASIATNLVTGDSNGKSDIFVRDSVTGTTIRVSVSAAGDEGNGDSFSPDISADGRYVVFQSSASNLVSGDTNGFSDIFVKDLQTGAVNRVNVDAGGGQATGGGSSAPAISADGKVVAFVSDAINLVANDGNARADIFWKDLVAGGIARVNLTSAGAESLGGASAPVLNSNGSVVAFYSMASDLIAGDTNSVSDIFVRDMTSGILTRASVSASGSQANEDSYSPALSGDGRYVAFYSYAANLVTGDTNSKADVFVKDLVTGGVVRGSVDSHGVQVSGGNSYAPALSADGRYLVFASDASNLVAGDTNAATDVFVKDLEFGTVTRLSVNTLAQQGSYNSFAPALSADGKWATFTSLASNLHPDDTNNLADVFVAQVPIALPGTISAVIDGQGNLVIEDTDSIGKDNRFSIKVDASGQLVVSDEQEIFISAPSGWTLTLPERTSIHRAASTFSGMVTVKGHGGTDQLLLDSRSGALPAVQFDGGEADLSNRLQLQGSQSVSLNSLVNVQVIQTDGTSANSLADISKANVDRIVGASASLLLRVKPSDVLGFNADWTYSGQAFVGSTPVHQLTASGGTSLLVQNDHLLNPLRPTDTNADGFVSPVDALLVINALNSTGGGPLVGGSLLDPGLIDVNGDGNVSPIDALMVINWLNSTNAMGEAEVIGDSSEILRPAGIEESLFQDLFWLDQDFVDRSKKKA
ncbi:MAG: dockerin type I domain-containing protein [Planctomycetaceae bacterium]